MDYLLRMEKGRAKGVEEILCALRSRLEKLGYFEFYKSFGDGNLRVDLWQAAARRISGPLRKCVEFFLLQRRVHESELVDLIGCKEANLLCRLSIVRKSKGMCECGFQLISFRNIAIFVELRRQVPEVYFDNDSIALGVYQSVENGSKVIDLCAGSGVQGLIASNHAREVICVEIHPHAAAVAEINVALNGRCDRVQVVNENALEFAKKFRGQVDHIIFNPPLVPIPDHIRYPLPGDGGGDGCKLTSNFIQAFSSKLNKKGSFQFVGSFLADSNGQLLINGLSQSVTKSNLHCDMFLLSKFLLKDGSSLFDSLVATAAAYDGRSFDDVSSLYRRHLDMLGATQVYFGFAKVYANNGHSASATRLMDLTHGLYGDWFCCH